MIIVDKLKSLFKVKRKIFVFLFVLMVVWIVFDSCLSLFLSVDDKTLVSDYLANFVNQIKSSFDYFLMFKNSLLGNFLFFVLIWLLGISMIGIPIVLFLFFYKCFIFGFSISSIIINYGFKGILFSFFYIFPHQVVVIFLFLIISSYSLSFSIKFIGLIFKKSDFNVRVSFFRYFKVFMVCFFVLCLCSLYETFIGSYFLRLVFSLIGL